MPLNRGMARQRGRESLVVLCAMLLVGTTAVLSPWLWGSSRYGYGFLDSYLSLFVPDTATEFAPAYDESTFLGIAPGTPGSRVRALLGSPLTTWPLRSGGHLWRYTLQTDPTGNCHMREFILGADGKVAERKSYVWVD